MPGFVRDVLGRPSPNLKQVTHERDLLALLQFNVADVVLISEVWANRFRKRSEMDLEMVPVPNEVGLPAVAFGSSRGRSALSSKIKAAGANFNASLGVTQWR